MDSEVELPTAFPATYYATTVRRHRPGELVVSQINCREGIWTISYQMKGGEVKEYSIGTSLENTWIMFADDMGLEAFIE